jgi:MFS transporter, BCD family, chlorophyll transporter
MNATPLNPPGSLGWFGIIRLGLVQAALGSIVVLVTSTLNRVMVVEYALPALLPGVLVALHYGVQFLRPRFGHGSDRGRRRTPWIVMGLGVLALGGFSCALATILLPQHLWAGLLVAVLAYGAVGLGVGAAGTSLLVLLATQAPSHRRAAAATVMWIMMIAGFAITSTVVGRYLDPFSAARLLKVFAMAVVIAFVIAVCALAGIEKAPVQALQPEPRAGRRDFASALRAVWSDSAARRFTWFVFVSMLAYSAQELLLEPFAGLVFGYSIGASARLSGLWHSSALMGMIVVGLACSFRGRFGTLRGWIIGGCVGSALALASLSFASFQSAHWHLQLSVITLGVANGAFAVAAIASMMELSHQGEAGTAGIRMGLWGAAQAVAFALGGLCGNFLMDVVRHVFGSPVPAYAAVFAAEAALFCAAALVALRMADQRQARIVTREAAHA